MTKIITAFYNLCFYLLLPFILLRLPIKSRRNKDYKRRWHERFGYYKGNKTKESIWIHAVSVGETIAAIPLIKQLLLQYPNIPLVVTTMTPTGSAEVQKRLGNSVKHVYVPYDYSSAIKKFLGHFNPKLAIIMETEIWPNLLSYCKKRNIAIIIANARLSPHSFKGYKKISFYIAKLLNYCHTIAAQSEPDAERFRALGVDNNKIKAIGNLKFDFTVPVKVFADAKALRKKWGETRPILVAASTHLNEEDYILTAYKTIKKTTPNLLLLIVPRHPERFAEVTKLCQTQGFNTITYSSEIPCNENTEIIVGDVMGKMLIFYATATVAFVGGSLVPTGGHNLLEPAATNTPIITGPYLSNFVTISELLTNANGLIKVHDPEELATAVIKIVHNQDFSQQLTTAAKKVIDSNRGALQQLLTIITKSLRAS